MVRFLSSLLVAVLFAQAALADPPPALSAVAIPAARCIHRVLKSSAAVQNVSLYAIDEFRFAAEYTFRNKAGDVVFSDIEFFPAGPTVMVGDKIPIEVSTETANEAFDLERTLDLDTKCSLSPVFDNVMPGPRARADWRKVDWPSE